eukprot:m.450240 g.450240  ORF g.450240 m.450240 type:complete len:89 (+) comp19949_c0_seq1:206-472(+)
MSSALESITLKVDQLQSEIDAANARSASAYERMTELQEKAAAAQREATEAEERCRRMEAKYKEEHEARVAVEKELAQVKKELDDLGLS